MPRQAYVFCGVLVDRNVGRVRSRGRFALIAVVAATATLLSGCGPDKQAAAGSAPGGSVSKAVVTPAAEVAVAPSDGTDEYRLDRDVAVTVKQGTIATVVVAPKEGSELKGELSSDQTSWVSHAPLKADTEYTVKVDAADAAGKKTTTSSTFSTLDPAHTASASIQPSDGSNVGVGMPVIFNLSRAVDEDKRDSVEDGLTVSSEPEVEGAFRWFSSRQVQWRPKEYWPTGAKVHVASKLSGIQLDKGVWGDSKADTADFTIGSSMVSTVDVGAHSMTVRKNGKVIKTIPVTTGRADMATRNGIKVIMSRETTHQMNSETIGIKKGDPDYYNLNVKYAMRLTYSGEFLHAAPWSTGSQGQANVSHGCTGMSTANARWMFDHSKMGDVVVYKGSKRPLEWGNGFTAWDMSYKSWKA